METIFVSKDNKQEYIEVDDFVRQGDYKYTYSDSSSTALKSEQADLVVSAVERFAQVIPLNMQEIFIWYFEQKGVDNPERFLIQEGVNSNAPSTLANEGLNTLPSNLENNAQPENPLSQNLPPQDLPQQSLSQENIEKILDLIKFVYQYASEHGVKESELEKMIESLEQIVEE